MAERTLLRAAHIVTMDAQRRIIHNGAVVVHNSVIERVLTSEEYEHMLPIEADVLDVRPLIIIPGFVQTHIHLCQTLFRGLADDLELLEWLKLRIMPFEAAHNASSMYVSAMIGLAELLRSGTTTIMDMGSVHHEEEVIRAVTESGIRAFVGKAMMDVNDLYPPLKESTRAALASARAFAEHVHGAADGRLRYAVAPRFILSCTDALLREAYEMTTAFPGMLFHTHAAENRHEMDAVRKRCAMDNVEYFEALGILHHNTCLAHCIWLNDGEIDLMRKRDAKVLHCPSSNLKLGSGIANIPLYRRRGITVSLGADGAPCNNTLDMFHEMRLAALMQKPLYGPTAMDARSVFEMATLSGATTLGLAHEVGSVEESKKADLVLLDLQRAWNPYTMNAEDDLYSAIVYSCTPENVHSVIIDGKWVYRDRCHRTLDPEALRAQAAVELRKLLSRMG